VSAFGGLLQGGWDFVSSLYHSGASTAQGWIDTAGGYYFGQDNWQNFKGRVKRIYDNPITQAVLLFVPGPEEIILGKLLLGLGKLAHGTHFLAMSAFLMRMEGRVHSVYEILDEANMVRYIGRTSRDVFVRTGEQEARFLSEIGEYWHIGDVHSAKDYLPSRYVEDSLIRKHGLKSNGGNLINRRYEIRFGSQTYRDAEDWIRGYFD
jgi:hypothetical protein